jgi:diketogulonate reductase-like aldo/keto reductase
MEIKDINTIVKLSNGVEMPALGFGVYQINDGKDVENAVKFALDAGYKHIDTATVYENEHGVGKTVKNHPAGRKNIFVTTKVWNSDHGYDRTIKAFYTSLEKLGFDYIDLFLVHWPVKGKFKETYRALETLYQEGKVRAIGVSNFMTNHIDDLLQNANIIPMVNQIEFHPYLVQPELIELCFKHNIQPEAWSPLMQGLIFNIKELNILAEKYNKSVSQITLRWNLQKGVVTIPKSSHKERIIENSNLYDFEISEEDMLFIDKLDKNKRVGPDPYNVNF